VSTDEIRDTVELTNLDQPLFEGATKRDLVEYLDAVRDRILPELADRPLSVVRVLRGQDPFMQKNVPKYTPAWVRTVSFWAERSKRDVAYAVCDDRRTLLWFANQRAVEYHVPLFRLGDEHGPVTMVLDIDPPEGSGFGAVVAAAQLVHEVLTEANLEAAVKTSGAKGVHVLVPIEPTPADDVAAATRAVAARAERLDPQLATTAFVRDERAGKVFLDSTRVGGATIVAAYSPRLRPGLPVSFPISWAELDDVVPADVTIHTAPELLVS
jgi:DNA ligase D-like protein (predicted polymerase)